MKNIKSLYSNLLFIFLITVSLLTGCQPTMFGVPQDQWNKLTPEQQSKVIDAYNERQQTEAQNAPLMAAIGAASTILKNNKASDPPAATAPAMPNIPMQGDCTTQGNTTNCQYSGSQSMHSHHSSFNNNFP
jgi:hypothetical protein